MPENDRDDHVADSKNLCERKKTEKEHKKRMRAAQARRRYAELQKVIELLISHIVTGDKVKPNQLAELYKPIQKMSKDFWSNIPDVLSPHGASLDLDIASEAVLKGEEARQKKFKRKLEQQVKAGVISETEANEKLEKFGRPKPKEGRDEKTSESLSFSLLNNDRGWRKRQQVENIASILFQRFTPKTPSDNPKQKRPLVVDFGCGSGNLCLALAAALPGTLFLLTDRNAQSLDLVSKRAKMGGLSNVVIKSFSFAWDNLDSFSSEVMLEYDQLWSLGIGLHCCGAFTDMVLELCRRSNSDCLVAPCCNGKMHQHFLEGQLARLAVDVDDKEKEKVDVDEEEKHTSHTLKDENGSEEGLSNKEDEALLNFYPRSKLFSSLLTRQQYWALSRAADDDNHYSAKCLVEYDRARGQDESGAKVSLHIMDPPSASPKHHVLYCARS